MPYYIKLIFFPQIKLTDVTDTEAVGGQDELKFFDERKNTIEASGYQVYERIRIRDTQVFQILICFFFAMKLKIRVVGTTISQLIIMYEGNLNFEWKPSIDFENY